MREGAAKLIILLNNGDGSYPFSSFYPDLTLSSFLSGVRIRLFFLKKILNFHHERRHAPAAVRAAAGCVACRVVAW